ncbi:MAG: prenyltransferase/squalene oxidase repeat-containing protein [Promethearchaeota archaeon]
MKYKYRNFIIITLILFFTVNTIPNVLGKTRQSYLADFILDTEIEGRGFSNAIMDDPSGDLVSFEATAYALYLLNNLGRNPKSDDTLETHLEGKIEDMFDSTRINIYNLYYLLNSLNLLEYTIDSSLSNRIYNYLNNIAQISGGFSFSNTTGLPTISSTFYAIQIYALIEQPILNVSIHKNWVLSCNNPDGGYGGNETSLSTYLDTSFAVFILDDERFGDIHDLINIDSTLAYLKSFYVNNSADLHNYGGFLPNELAGNALLSSTYYCVKAISIIDNNILNNREIQLWVLKHQNFEDGGFFENTGEFQPKISSVVSCFYAFKTLEILNLLSSLLYEIWTVEFNFLILGIVLGSIGLIIAIAIFLWRRRRI